MAAHRGFTALVTPLRADADAGLQRWRAAADPIDPGRSALLSAARTYRRHGVILRAVFWSSVEDPDVAIVRRALADAVVTVAEEKLRAAGTCADPHATAAALVTMNIHSLLALVPETSDVDLEKRLTGK